MHSLNTDLYVNLLFCCRTNPQLGHTSESCLSLVRVEWLQWRGGLPRLTPTVYFPRGLWCTALSTFTFLLHHCRCVKHEFIIRKITHYKTLTCLSVWPSRGRCGSWVQVLHDVTAEGLETMINLCCSEDNSSLCIYNSKGYKQELYCWIVIYA